MTAKEWICLVVMRKMAKMIFLARIEVANQNLTGASHGKAFVCTVFVVGARACNQGNSATGEPDQSWSH